MSAIWWCSEESRTGTTKTGRSLTLKPVLPDGTEAVVFGGPPGSTRGQTKNSGCPIPKPRPERDQEEAGGSS